MGGTFNPIHNGHLTLAKVAFRQLKLDEVLFVPCGMPYMKVGQKIASAKDRVKMTALAIQDIPEFTLSTVEIEQQGNTYTYVTLEHLKTQNPDTEYYFIVGADSLFHMTQWACPERIFANCCVLAAVRNDKTDLDMERQIHFLKERYHADIRLLQTECMDISSSDIRRRVHQGEPIGRDVPKAVREYIERKGLYQ